MDRKESYHGLTPCKFFLLSVYSYMRKSIWILLKLQDLRVSKLVQVVLTKDRMQ